MGKYRKVDPRIWNDQKFASLSNGGKLAFLFILTHPHMTALGAMRATIPGLVAELQGVPEKAFREAFQKGLARIDEKACFLWLPRFLKYNPPESPNVVKAWSSAFDLLPECNLKNQMIEGLKAYAEGLGEAFREALAKAMPKTMPYQEQEQEQEQEPKENTICPEPRGVSGLVPVTPHPPTPPEKVPVLTIPLSSKAGEFTIYRKDIDEWQVAYPGVNIQTALQACRQWNISNPTRRKTIKGIRNHITAWMDRAQNKGQYPVNGNGRQPSGGPPMPRTYRECQDAERRVLADFVVESYEQERRAQGNAEACPGESAGPDGLIDRAATNGQ